MDAKMITTTEALELAGQESHKMTLATLTHALRRGYIDGTEKHGRDWQIPRDGFLKWLHNPEFHTPGAKRSQMAYRSWNRKATKAIAGHVYMIQSGDKIKIGFSMDVSRRLRDLAASSPLPCTLVLDVQSSSANKLEHALHQMLKPAYSHGEWFDAANDRTLIDSALTLMRSWE